MKIVYLATIMITLLYGCAGKSSSISPLSPITLESHELQIPEPILYIAEESFFEAIIKEENINPVKAPFEEDYIRCGGVYPAEQDTAELLRNAKTVFVLKGSYEMETPGRKS